MVRFGVDFLLLFLFSHIVQKLFFLLETQGKHDEMLSLGHQYPSNGLLLPLYISECLLNKTLNNIFIDFLVVFFYY